MSSRFNESSHRRVQAGSSDGGQFTVKERGESTARLGEPVQEYMVGVTPFHVSSSDRRYQKPEYRQDYYATGEWKEFIATVDEQAAHFGLEIADCTTADGLWLGEAEPSLGLQLRGTPAAVRDFCTSLAARYRQDSVMLAAAGKGDSTLVTIAIPDQDEARVFDALKLANLDGGRIVHGQLEVVFPADDGRVASARLALELALEAPAEEVKTSVDFIEAPADHPERLYSPVKRLQALKDEFTTVNSHPVSPDHPDVETVRRTPPSRRPADSAQTLTRETVAQYERLLDSGHRIDWADTAQGSSAAERSESLRSGQRMSAPPERVYANTALSARISIPDGTGRRIMVPAGRLVEAMGQVWAAAEGVRDDEQFQSKARQTQAQTLSPQAQVALWAETG